jgi:hypothetical protein
MKLSKTVLRFRLSILFWSTALSFLLLFGTIGVAQQQSAQDLLAQADEVLQQMSQITGLPIKTPVKKQVISRPEIEKYLVENLHQEMTPAEVHAQEALVQAFGLVPRDFKLEQFLITFYTEQAAGFYDPKRKTMFIADWTPPETQGMVLSHELTHALQDQSWDLESFMHGARNDDDATDARQAVVEGYATAAMMQQAAGGLELGQLPSISPLLQQLIPAQFDEFPAFTHAPYFFRMQALFPYVQGIGFIQAGLQLGGWKNLVGLFEHPPETSKQIFEPQTYFNHQAITRVTLAHPPALESVAGLRFLSENSMGELGYYSLLVQLISQDEAETVGEAWLSDRYLLYEHSGGDQYALVARTRWTNPDKAAAFFRDYQTILAHKYSGLSTDKRSSSDEFIASAANGVTLLLRHGDECLWAEGVPADKADAMLAWLRAL